MRPVPLCSGVRAHDRDGEEVTLRIGGWLGWVVLLALLFIRPLARLVLYAAGSDLHFYILLVPFVFAYLLSTRRAALPTQGPDRFAHSSNAQFAAEATCQLILGQAILAGVSLWNDGSAQGQDS